MPLVTAQPRGLQNGSTVTEFTDTTNTSLVTYTYPTTQSSLIIENSGERDIFVTVGTVTNQVIQVDKKWRYDGAFSSFSIRSDVNSQEFIATAIYDDSINTKLAEKANLMTDNSLEPLFVDMHYEILKGTGWLGENPNAQVGISLAALKGDTTLQMYSTTDFLVGQLIYIYHKTEDRYYINKIMGKTSNTLTLLVPLESDLPLLSYVGSLYVNQSHPNSYTGYYAICDEVLRDFLKTTDKLIRTIYPSEMLLEGTTTRAPLSLTDYSKFTSNGSSVTFNTQNNRIYKDFYISNPGEYKFKIYINSKNQQNIKFWVRNTTLNIDERIVSIRDYDSLDTLEVSLYLREGTHTFAFYLGDPYPPKTIEVFKLEIYEIKSRVDFEKLNSGVHLLLGDSWFNVPGFDIELPKLLPKATIKNYGVGGNQLQNLINRFIGTATNADNTGGLSQSEFDSKKNATLETKIDYVWVMCGTNDYLNAKDPNTFKAQMTSLISYIIARGAKPIIFNSSVGQVGVGNNLLLSRQYTELFVKTNEVNDSFDQLSKSYRTLIPIYATVAVGQKQVIASFHLESTQKVSFPKIDWNSGASLEIDIGYSASHLGTTGLTNMQTVTNENARNVVVTPETAPRYLNVVLVNNSASSYTFVGGVQMVVEPIK